MIDGGRKPAVLFEMAALAPTAGDTRLVEFVHDERLKSLQRARDQ
jgi:hypothetical protein